MTCDNLKTEESKPQVFGFFYKKKERISFGPYSRQEDICMTKCVCCLILKGLESIKNKQGVR